LMIVVLLSYRYAPRGGPASLSTYQERESLVYIVETLM